MFKTSSESTAMNMFSNITSHLRGVRLIHYEDKDGWHNLFWQHITSKIDEKPFKQLFSDKMGAPNASIRVLVAMMILKEGFGCSDERLFEQSQFDLLIMKALGLNNVDDKLPCSATYYNLRKAIYEHQINTAEDIIGEVFKDLTKGQAKLFGVNGKFARMDSKLIGSNIAKCSRLQLIINVLQVFYKEIKKNEHLLSKLESSDKEFLESLCSKKAGQIVYGLDNKEKEGLLFELGNLLMHLQSLYSERDSEKYSLIERIFTEQYKVETDQVMLKENKEIRADSLQSPFDEDAAYRDKNGQQVQGYSANLTETCNEDGLNLITDVKVEDAGIADNNFVEESIEKSQEVVGHIEHLNADGAYHSVGNQHYAKKNKTEMILSGMQGRKGKYEYEPQQKNTVKVTNTKTGKSYLAEQYKKDKYKFNEEGMLKYITAAMIMNFIQRKAIESIPKNEINRRNNVEASLFQLCYFTRNNKTRYRSKYKHQSWAFCRGLWLNLVRIRNYLGEVRPIEPIFYKKQQILQMQVNY